MAPTTDFFKIYVDQLRFGKVAELDEEVPAEFLELAAGDELVCVEPVHIKGEAYIANQELVLHMELETKGKLPCSICNEPVDVEVVNRDFYHVVPQSEIKSSVFDFKELVREALLLEAPHFVECQGGKCPQRKELDKYLKKTSPEKEGSEETYRPFADLEKD